MTSQGPSSSPKIATDKRDNDLLGSLQLSTTLCPMEQYTLLKLEAPLVALPEKQVTIGANQLVLALRFIALSKDSIYSWTSMGPSAFFMD